MRPLEEVSPGPGALCAPDCRMQDAPRVLQHAARACSNTVACVSVLAVSRVYMAGVLVPLPTWS